MTEELLKSILDELKSINTKLSSMEDVVEVMSEKMNWQEEKFDSLISGTKEVEKGVDGVRSDISDLKKKVISEMPNLGNIEYTVENIDFKDIINTLKNIDKNTR